jgi:serine/threonine-protein kinase RsbW
MPVLPHAYGTPPRQTEVRLDFRACPHAVRGALIALRGSLAGAAMSREDADRLELVVAEVLNNVVEHAYADDPQGIVTLIARPCRTGVAIQVRDQGRAMPDGTLPSGTRPVATDNTEALPEGGFGWFLIRDMTEDIRYRRVGPTNQLTFRLAFTTPSDA